VASARYTVGITNAEVNSFEGISQKLLSATMTKHRQAVELRKPRAARLKEGACSAVVMMHSPKPSCSDAGRMAER
jgi:hypothetical protein